MAKPPPPPSQEDTILALLASSQRDSVPIRHTFVQQRDAQNNPLPGPLAKIVKRGVASALEQYLLLHARAAGKNGDANGEMEWDVTLESRVWARALGLQEDESGRRTVQRNWKALEAAGLVSLELSGRLVRVTLLREDGTGEPYTHPAENRQRYIKLPYSYWTAGHAQTLKTLPAKALLLILMHLPDWSILPFHKGPNWYGIGSSTVERGVRELRRADRLEVHYGWKKAELSLVGWAEERRYRLLPPFGPRGKVAKGAPDELLSPPNGASPSSQADSPNGQPKRRTPAAKKPKGRRTAAKSGRKPAPRRS